MAAVAGVVVVAVKAVAGRRPSSRLSEMGRDLVVISDLSPARLVPARLWRAHPLAAQLYAGRGGCHSSPRWPSLACS
ncbi:hypothetical protein L226DRAFT_528467 [Lentinus tigrinus ALCF2SS1-7]|uniref:uncharacterized protein n=1 Tax=Lentinus tigrinus ALCF2SS1-7 TaxID=1328758 RepID=UPI001165DB0C|nr:hypothetical protein L226DRAFT_528467 [Lentinus tigrinus ALCF2SS1-7]